MATSVDNLTVTVKFDGELTPQAREVLRQMVREEVRAETDRILNLMRANTISRDMAMHPPEVK